MATEAPKRSERVFTKINFFEFVRQSIYSHAKNTINGKNARAQVKSGLSPDAGYINCIAEPNRRAEIKPEKCLSLLFNKNPLPYNLCIEGGEKLHEKRFYYFFDIFGRSIAGTF